MTARRCFLTALTHTALLTTVPLMGACGGSDPASPGSTTPPVTPPSTPTSLVVVAGDAQTAIPNAALPVKPMVAVKDAAGLGVAGVAVTFSVDSGNGVLQSTSATTAADGTASPGDWRLGAGEGRNVITARAGSLPALKMVATALVATVTIAGQNVPTSGGVVTLTQSGSAFNGTTLTIPSGALSAAGTIGFTISSATAVTLPAGMTAVTPALTLAGPAGQLKMPASLRLPIVAPAGKILLVLAQDALTGAFSVLPSSATNASGTTVSLGSIDAPAAAAATVASSEVSVQAPTQPIIISVSIDPSLLAPDFDSNFRPGADDWEFRRQLISSFPENLSGGLVDPAASMIATSLWYFTNRKALSGKLYEKFEDAVGIPESNRRGLRWASVANQGIPDLYAPGGLATTTRTGYQASPATQAQQEMYEIKAAFLLSGNKPQPIFVFTAANAAVDSEPRYGSAYRTVGNAIDLAIPDAAGKTFRITLSPTGWTPASVTTSGGVTYTVDFVAPIQYGIFVQNASLAPQYPLVAAGTIGDAQGWPKSALNSAFGALDTVNVYLLDQLQHWWECAACVDHGYRSASINPSPTRVIVFRNATQNTDLTWNSLPTTVFGAATFSSNLLGSRTAGKMGYALIQPGAGSSVGFVKNPAWLDWIAVTYKKLPVDVRPDSVLTFGDTTVAYTTTVTGAPSGIGYRWKYVGKVTDSTDTTVPSFSRRMTEPGRAMMYSTVLDGIKKRPIGRDSSAVIYANAWQFQTATLTSTVLPPGGIGSERSDTLGLQLITRWSSELQQTPINNLLMLYRGPNNCRAVMLEGFPNGQVVDTGLVQEAFRAVLADNCPDPDLTGTFAMGPPGQGTLVGSATATNADPDVLVVPGGAITATMNGFSLQGTLVWKFRYSTGIALYTFNFQARVLVPK